MSPQTVLKDEVTITESDNNVTLTAGTANQESTIAEFTCPDRTAYIIRPGDIMSLTVKDTTPTEVADTSLVKVIHTDPQGVVKRVVANPPYTRVTEWQDRNKLFTFGGRTELRPDDRLQIVITANLAADTAQTKFQITALRGLATII